MWLQEIKKDFVSLLIIFDSLKKLKFVCTYLVKLWGSRWQFLTEIHPHTVAVSHLIEHPGGRACISFSRDQLIFAWSFDSQKKVMLEFLKVI